MSVQNARAVILGSGGISRAHAGGYAWAGIPVVAAADIVEDNAKALAEQYQIANTYTDYRELLEKERPEIVSICTWPPLHEEMALAAVESGAKAIVCEKPIATNLAAADRMVQACRTHNVLLTIGHQRRYEKHYIGAARLIKEGGIGEVERIQISQAGDLISDGVHSIDLAFFLLGDPNAQWVIGQIDRSGTDPSVDAPSGLKGKKMEDGGWRYGHAVEQSALATAGTDAGPSICIEMGQIRRAKVYIDITVIGSEGLIRVDTNGRLQVINGDGETNQSFDHDGAQPSFGMALRDVKRFLDGEIKEHPLDVKYHWKALEVCMAAFESSRQRRRIQLPLAPGESALEAMVAAGQL